MASALDNRKALIIRLFIILFIFYSLEFANSSKAVGLLLKS